MFKSLQNIASFAQLQLKSINIGAFLTKLSILVNISATVIEMFTFNNGLPHANP